MIWRALAWVLSRRPVTYWLIERAQRTPYSHIWSKDGTRCYMRRWWLFNPYPGSDQVHLRRFAWLPLSIRIHHILRADEDRHLHDHPWDARTIILDGGYAELKQDGLLYVRERGYAGRLDHGTYHRIDTVSEGGVLTLFITYRYRGTWGFLVNGRKVPWRTYLGV